MSKLNLLWLGALITILVAGWYLCVQSPYQSPEVPQNEPQAILGGNALIAISPPVFPEYKIYGTLVSEIVECESGGKHEIWGKAGEYGIAQFMEKTFYWLAEKSGLKNPDWKSKDQQLWLLNWAVENGHSEEWTCAKNQ